MSGYGAQPYGASIYGGSGTASLPTVIEAYAVVSDAPTSDCELIAVESVACTVSDFARFSCTVSDSD